MEVLTRDTIDFMAKKQLFFDPASIASSLVELLRWRAMLQPQKVAYRYLVDGDSAEQTLTYGELDLKARAIAASLQAHYPAGESALLLLSPSLEYVSAFFGCLYAGMVAVPAEPPSMAKNDPALANLRNIVASASPVVALTGSPFLFKVSALTAQVPELAGLRWVATDMVPERQAARWQDPRSDRDTLALLDFNPDTQSSQPVAHGSLLQNAITVQNDFEYNSYSESINWLLPYNGLGLFTGIIQPLFSCSPVTIMSPLAFRERPARWLEAITRFRATHSGAPAEAYELCARMVTPEEKARLDLRSWVVAFVTTDVESSVSMGLFSGAFAECGFEPGVFKAGNRLPGWKPALALNSQNN
ncbi:MAG TPA: AMP-binding protein [Chloroflexia bacterium]|nr:AMP-binding protein [Chloroflexia bacterium]